MAELKRDVQLVIEPEELMETGDSRFDNLIELRSQLKMSLEVFDLMDRGNFMIVQPKLSYDEVLQLLAIIEGSIELLSEKIWIN